MRARAAAEPWHAACVHLPWLLVGFSGCGKSTVGPRVARLAGRTFVDLDGVVSVRAGLPVDRLLDHVGEEAFRDLEARALEVLLTTPTPDGEPLVIALGGGSLESEPVRALAGRCLTAWLDVPLAHCLARLEGASRRPLLEAARSEGGHAALERLHGARSVRHAEATVRVDGTPHADVVARAVVLALSARESAAGEE